MQPQLFAQDPDLVKAYDDSLVSLVQQAKSDSIRISYLFNLSRFWSDIDTAMAFDYLRQAESYMGAAPSNYNLGLAAHHRANIIFAHDMENAKHYYRRADSYLSNYENPSAYNYRAKAWNNYGSLLQQQDSSSQFMDLLVEKSLPFARKSGDSTLVASYLLNIGLLLMNIQSHEMADGYYEQALNTISIQSTANDSKFEILINRAKNALYAKQFNLANTYLRDAELIQKNVTYPDLISSFYRVKGTYYRHIGMMAESIANLDNSLALAINFEDDYAVRDIYFEVYATYRDFKEFSKAKKYLDLAIELDSNPTTQNRLLYLKEMANILNALGKSEDAFKQMEAYALAKDTFHENNMALKILELEKKYKTVEKENQILRLEEVNTLNENRLLRNRWLIYLLFAGIVFVLATSYFIWKLSQKNLKLLSQQERLHQEEIKTLEQEQRLANYDAIMHGQEQERNRIARDLHDGLGGLLAGSKLKLSAILDNQQKEGRNEQKAIEDVVDQLDYSVDELRRISRNMMPESLLLMGLTPALADLCKYMSNESTEIKFQSFDISATYSRSILINCYRIVQELITNALKHSRASEIIVQCSQMEGTLFITVEDNGLGFRENISYNGIGIQNVKNRVALLRGTVEILSSKKEGTTINLQIPISYA
ncbi:sensor histidine kinase [Algoriphagus sp.]|uniref:sensor histidine kinase n=1 Tax=Algoriphagus sp. TaxID=1872435 RepID=UPI003F6F1943